MGEADAVFLRDMFSHIPLGAWLCVANFFFCDDLCLGNSSFYQKWLTWLEIISFKWFICVSTLTEMLVIDSLPLGMIIIHLVAS